MHVIYPRYKKRNIMKTISSPIYASWLLLKITYAIVPIIIGLDKIFTWWIVDWSRYTSPFVMSFIPFNLMQFIMFTGAVEIIAGIIVWFFPRFGAYLVFAWMVLVIIDLVSLNMFYDIIARDVVIAIGALVLAWLSEVKDKK